MSNSPNTYGTGNSSHLKKILHNYTLLDLSDSMVSAHNFGDSILNKALPFIPAYFFGNVSIAAKSLGADDLCLAFSSIALFSAPLGSAMTTGIVSAARGINARMVFGNEEAVSKLESLVSKPSFEIVKSVASSPSYVRDNVIVGTANALRASFFGGSLALISSYLQ